MIRLSVVLITLNEERNLARCLASVNAIGDEIVVVDSGSSDRTQEIALSYGARVVVQPFLGYVAQKNFATEQASHDWVLSIDADEELSPGLVSHILEVKRNPAQPAYRLARLTNYCGHWIRHCGWYPDVKLRLYDRTRGSWQGEQIHEHWEFHDRSLKAGMLSGELLHYSYYTISDHLKQIEKFSEILARTAVDNGKTGSLFKVFFAPKFKFITDFIFRLGFLDGYAGYLVCRYSAVATLVKYTKIYQYSRFKKQGIPF